jgi:hypothetical protein
MKLLVDNRIVSILNGAGLKTAAAALHGKMVQNDCSVDLQLFRPAELAMKATEKVSCHWGGEAGVVVSHKQKVRGAYEIRGGDAYEGGCIYERV